MDLLTLGINSVFKNNILLAYFLGMCSFLAISKQMQTAAGLGLAVILVMAITAPINWLLYHYLLAPNALAWLGLAGIDLSYLTLVIFIAAIAAVVQVAEIIIDRYSPPLYQALGIFLPLITVNCAILGVSLFMVERQYSLPQTFVYGTFSGVGWCMAIIIMAGIQKKMRYARPPKGLQGFGINMIITGLIAIGFMLF